MGASLLKVAEGTRLEIHELSLGAVEVDAKLFQSRAETDESIITDLKRIITSVKGGEVALPPVTVCRTPDERLILADGFHRHKAHKRAHKASIRAVIREIQEAREALLVGIDANMNSPTSFRAPNDNDRQHAAKLMVRDETFRQWSDNEIARRCGVSYKTVRSVRFWLRAREGIPLPERVLVFRDGRPTGRTRPYLPKAGGKPTLTLRADGQHRMNVGGEKRYLSSDPAQARRNYDRIVAETEAARRVLEGENYHFLEWLHTRAIPARLLSRTETILGGLAVGETLVLVLKQPSVEGLLGAVGRLVLLRRRLPTFTRGVLIGQFRANTMIGKVASLVRAHMPEVELMELDQFVAAFGPKETSDGT